MVAYSTNRVIGAGGGVPWHLPGDMRCFRELTTGGTVVMGRRTFESLPERFRPLPDRRNLVISSASDYRAVGAEVLPSLRAGLSAAGEDCFVIGGGVVYGQALPLAARVYATEVHAEIQGDVFFPELSPEQWSCVSEGEPVTENGLEYARRVYERSR